MHGRFSFVVAELQSMYNELLKSDKIPVSPHISRFTERLLDALPDFMLQKLDRKNTITYSHEKDLVKNILKKNQSSLAKALLKVVLLIRKQMSEVTNSFQGNFPVNCQQESIPFPLLSLCSLLIDGADPTPTNVSQAALSVSQLIMFSYKKQSKIVQTNETSLANRRNLKKREAPLLLYVGLKLMTIRAKTIETVSSASPYHMTDVLTYAIT